MKKGLIKVISAMAAAVMCAAALTGCGGDKSGQLVMGTNAAFPPFEFTTSNGLVGEFDGKEATQEKIMGAILSNNK